jgi:hypothetical protein
LEYPTQLELNTPNGTAKLEKIYFTDLGHIMAKVYYPSRKEWIRYTIGNLSELANSSLDFSSLNFTNYKERIYKKVLDKC